MFDDLKESEFGSTSSKKMDEFLNEEFEDKNKKAFAGMLKGALMGAFAGYLFSELKPHK